MASREEAPQTIELKILSPSPEVGNAGLHFDSLPVSTTVGELKDRIQDGVSSRPAHDRQRLIYLGRALVQDSDTLLDVFGATAVSTSLCYSQTHSSVALRLTGPSGPGTTSAYSPPRPA
jgi:hypothetical protein